MNATTPMTSTNTPKLISERAPGGLQKQQAMAADTIPKPN
jgi:hypothetical protein